MAGSLLNFTYTSDSGAQYAVTLDESNAEAVGFPRLTSASILGLPRNIQMRYVNTQVAGNPAKKRRFYLPTLAIFNSTIATGHIDAEDYPGAGELENWIITSSRGEKAKVYQTTDTGLNDGDT